MLLRASTLALVTSLFVGCASVPTLSPEQANVAKQFNSPSAGKAGLYVLRDSPFGAALKKDIWVDGNCLGQSAAKVFFFTEVEGNQKHTVSTESEFSPNSIEIDMKEGLNYFVRQYIKMGVVVGGANLEVLNEEQGKKAVSPLKQAANGTCSSTFPIAATSKN